MFVLDPAAMREIDARTIAAGTPSLTLMERAGTGAARELLARPQWLWGTTLIVCGRGNNGGDGLVMARRLIEAGHQVEVLLTADVDRLSEDARHNHERFLAAQGTVIDVADDPARRLLERDRAVPGRTLVDAGLGTGFSPPLRDPWVSVAQAITATGRRVVALDAPTGLDGASGEVDPHTAVADLTVTFGFPKWGLLLAPGRRHCGRIARVDLEIPRDIAETVAASSPHSGLWVDRTLAAGWWVPRPVDAHKYTVGTLLVVGGSVGMSGAPTLATLGGYRAGAGLVETVVPGRQQLAVDVQCPEALVHGVAETRDGGLSPDVLDFLVERSGRADALVVGPGGGAGLETAALFLDLIAARTTPVVIDADALGAFHRLQVTPRFEAPTVLTPHSGELSRLLDIESRELEANRLGYLRDCARAWNAVVVHKGAPNMVADADGTVAVIATGGPSLATAGTGDVLSGVIGALLAAGVPAFRAAGLGVYLHGRAGDLAERRWGVAGVMARDVVAHLGHAIGELEGSVR